MLLYGKIRVLFPIILFVWHCQQVSGQKKSGQPSTGTPSGGTPSTGTPSKSTPGTGTQRTSSPSAGAPTKSPAGAGSVPPASPSGPQNITAGKIAPYALPDTGQWSSEDVEADDSSIPSNYPKVQHPLLPVDVTNPSNLPIGTNKWYSQLTLAGSLPIFPLPYAVVYSNGVPATAGAPSFVGIGISHRTAAQRVYGDGDPAQSYSNGLDLSMVFSAVEITAANVKGSLTGWSEFAATFSLAGGLDPGAPSTTAKLSVPMSRGSAFFTTLYSGLTPTISSSFAIKTFDVIQTPVNGFSKARISYADGSTWLIYSAPKDPAAPQIKWVQQGQNLASSTQGFTGAVQVVKMSDAYTSGSNEESIYDAGVGVWPIGASLAGITSGGGQFKFKWNTDGPRAATVEPLIFALPHHVASLTAPSAVSPAIELNSRVNGKMTLYQGKAWTFTEDVKTPAEFSVLTDNPTIPQPAPHPSDLATLLTVATDEVNDPAFTTEANLPSYYFSGKKLAKEALQCLTISTILHNDALATSCVTKVKANFMMFITGKAAVAPLVYDTVWKGLISSAGLKDPNADFGNSYYNDHHFHWGYFVHAAAILSKLDKTFIPSVTRYIQMFIRDINTSHSNDPDFPAYRYFDWFVGHSWAAGLQGFADGKDEESGSEDVNFFYGLKTWAEVTNRPKTLNLANLQLAILKRSLGTYFFMKNDNTAQPANYIRHRVPGITFENKVDYSTWFSALDEAKHMVQVLPVTPITPFIRTNEFVTQEWTDTGAPGSPQISTIASQRQTGYQTILYAQYASVDPRTVFDTVSQNLKTTVIDDGQSFTWILGYAISQLGVKP